MKTTLLVIVLLSVTTISNAQTKNVEIYDFITRLIPGDQENGSVGDWSVDQPNAFSVKWKDDGVQMSDDLKINFYRRGAANLTTNGTAAKWAVMLKGARSGYSSFSLSSPVLSNMHAPIKLGDVFGKHDYVSQISQACHDGAPVGFDYYRVVISKKGMEWVKVLELHRQRM